MPSSLVWLEETAGPILCLKLLRKARRSFRQRIYDSEGKRQTVTRDWADDTTDDIWQYTYQADTGRLASVTDPFNRTITYEYDHNGNRTALTTPQGRQEFTFDALNRMASAKDRFNNETTYEYEGPARLQLTHLPNGINSTNIYDDLDRLHSITHQSAEHLYSSFTYTLSPSGLRTAVAEVLRPEGDPDDTDTFESDVAYGYDDLGRLISEERTRTYEPYTIAYTYDDAGNRIQLDRDSTITTYEYNERDFLTSEVKHTQPEVTTGYDFDANGNMTLKQVGTGPEETYGWDPENRVRTYEQDAGPMAAFEYDAEGIRYFRDEPAATPATFTQFLVDGNRPYAEVLEEHGVSGLKMEYFNADGIVSQGSAAAGRFFLTDGQLSTRQTTGPEPNRDVTAIYSYEGFGEDLSDSLILDTPYRFAGQQFDGVSSTYYLRARYYSPHVGRFATGDFVLGDPKVPRTMHLYAYAMVDPINRRDPSGFTASPYPIPRPGGYVDVLVAMGIGLVILAHAVGPLAKILEQIREQVVPDTRERTRTARDTTLDTSVLIDASHVDPLTTAYLRARKGSFIMSSYAEIEFLAGNPGAAISLESMQQLYDIDPDYEGSHMAGVAAIGLRLRDVDVMFAKSGYDMEIAMHAMVTATRLGSTDDKLIGRTIPNYNGWVLNEQRKGTKNRAIGYSIIVSEPIPHLPR